MEEPRGQGRKQRKHWGAMEAMGALESTAKHCEARMKQSWSVSYLPGGPRPGGPRPGGPNPGGIPLVTIRSTNQSINQHHKRKGRNCEKQQRTAWCHNNATRMLRAQFKEKTPQMHAPYLGPPGGGPRPGGPLQENQKKKRVVRFKRGWRGEPKQAKQKHSGQ